jgi:uncharacterized protein (DUF1015 family)
VGKSFASALPDAVERLSRQRADGSYAPADGAVALYRISEPGRLDEAAYGMFAMVDTDQISTSADEPGLVIRNEDVFIEKVRERVALAQALGHLLSPVLLLQTGSGAQLHERLRAVIASAGAPAVTDVDQAGREHAIWALPAGDPAAVELAELAGRGQLVVADGNHRSLAAQIGGLPRFLAVVTTPASVEIQPYHRLVTHSPVPLTAVLDHLRAAGANVTFDDGPDIPPAGTVLLIAADERAYVRLPPPPDTITAGPPAASPHPAVVDGMDHTVVERLVLGEALGLDPGDKRIVYVGGDYPPAWLASAVEGGRADLAVLVAPVTVDQFVAVNLARQKMPRKSTWFTPKARGGLVLADLSAE